MSELPKITEQDFRRRRGDTKAHRIVIKNLSDGTAKDITGFTFLWMVNPSKAPTDNTETVLTMTGSIVDAANGIVDFAPANEAAADIEPGKYYYDLQMTDVGGVISTEMKGVYRIEQDIAK